MLAPRTVDEQPSPSPIGDNGGVLVRYTTAATLGRLADEGSRVALLLAALQHGQGAAFGGILVAALMVPHVAAAPLIGALADRVRDRRLLHVAGLLLFGLGLAGGAALAGPAPVAAVAVVILAGCVAPLLIGGMSSLLGDLAPANRQRAFGLDATSYGAAGIAGPALAAVLASAFGAVWAAAGLGAACCLGAVFVATLPIRRAAGPRPRERGAVRALWRSPSLASVTAGTSLGQLGMGALPIVAAVLAVRAHDPALTGITLSVMAVGDLTGSLVYTARPIRRWKPETVVVVSLLTMTIPFALVPVVDRTPVTLVLFATAGLLTGPLFCALLAVRDREAPPALRTQVFTIGAGLKVTAGAAGAALAGFGTGLGPAVLVFGVAGSQLLAAGVAAALLRRRPAPSASPARP
jgi:MFS family permease